MLGRCVIAMPYLLKAHIRRVSAREELDSLLPAQELDFLLASSDPCQCCAQVGLESSCHEHVSLYLSTTSANSIYTSQYASTLSFLPLLLCMKLRFLVLLLLQIKNSWHTALSYSRKVASATCKEIHIVYK